MKQQHKNGLKKGGKQMKYFASLLLLSMISLEAVEAKSSLMYGYLKGQIGEVSIDEKIACHGQNKIPEAFIQEYPPLIDKIQSGRMKIGGGTDGKRLTLIVKGNGIDKTLMVRGIKHLNGSYVYTGTIKYRKKPNLDVDIKFWCSPEIDHSKMANKKISKTKKTKVPYVVRYFESIGHGVIDAGSITYKFEVADCSLNAVKQDNGWTKEFEILGAGVSNGKDFLVNISQSKKGRKILNGSVIRFAPLPEATTSADMKAFIYLQKVDAIQLMAENKHSAKRLIVKGNQVVSESTVRLVHTGSGFMATTDRNPREATVLVQCDK